MNGVTANDYKTSVFPLRPIYLRRTAYSSIAQLRGSLPFDFCSSLCFGRNRPTQLNVSSSIEEL